MILHQERRHQLHCRDASNDKTWGTLGLGHLCRAVIELVCPSLAMPPFNVTATSVHVHNSALQSHSQCLGAGEATGPAGQVLGRD